jgi:cytochrome c-type biogenesis protein CcmH
MLAEHRVFAAGGVVSPAAVADFEAALAADANQPAARFYLALARAQAGDYRTALDGWLALARESPADAPWMAALREQIDQAAGALGVALPTDIDGIEATETTETTEGIAAGAPGPSAEDVAAAQEMSEGEQAEMIRAMVARLAIRLEDEPGDLDGWRRLGRSYDMLGETAAARDAYARAAALAPGDVAALAEYADALGRAAPAGGPVSADAVAVYRRLLALDGDSPVALWHLGRAAAESGYDDEARALWQRLLAVLPPGGEDYDIVRGAIDGLGGASGG